jgi:uncharacterized protein YndB with AHSA1/START domain
MQIEKRISIHNTTIEKVYKMWATIDGMEQWLLRMCAYKKTETDWYSAFDVVTAGALYSWYWYGVSNDAVRNGKIVEANGIDKLAFTFTQDETINNIYVVNLHIEADAVICTLLISDMQMDSKDANAYYTDTISSWTFYLTNLKSVLEKGHDLRNKNEQITNVLNN